MAVAAYGPLGLRVTTLTLAFDPLVQWSQRDLRLRGTGPLAMGTLSRGDEALRSGPEGRMRRSEESIRVMGEDPEQARDRPFILFWGATAVAVLFLGAAWSTARRVFSVPRREFATRYPKGV